MCVQNSHKVIGKLNLSFSQILGIVGEVEHDQKGRKCAVELAEI
jgi:hypothetical protein